MLSYLAWVLAQPLVCKLMSSGTSVWKVCQLAYRFTDLTCVACSRQFCLTSTVKLTKVNPSMALA